MATNFNPRSPCGERPVLLSLAPCPAFDFNPRSPCGERLAAAASATRCRLISIHAPRAGSDRCRSGVCRVFVISIHAPRAGSDKQ